MLDFFFEDGTRGNIDCKCWVLIINRIEKMNIVFTMALTGFQGSCLEHERETDQKEAIFQLKASSSQNPTQIILYFNHKGLLFTK